MIYVRGLNHINVVRPVIATTLLSLCLKGINGPALSIFRLARHHRKVDDFQGSGAAVERLSSEEEDPGSMSFSDRRIPSRRVTPERKRVVLKVFLKSS